MPIPTPDPSHGMRLSWPPVPVWRWCDELERRGEGVGFVAVRPPGHHALADRAMGFCLLNNVAIAAAALAERGERVVIVDWDVHHGNGTQAIFWDDPRVAYCSTHQWPYYPGTGSAAESGGPNAPEASP